MSLTQVQDVIATDPAERDAAKAGRLPQSAQVSDGVWMLPLAIEPGRMPYSLSYLVAGKDGLHLIDPGWNLDENVESINGLLHTLGRPLASIIVTHLHPDHIGLAERLRVEHGAPVILHRIEAQGQAEVVQRNATNAAILADLASWGAPPARIPEIAAAYPRSEDSRVAVDIVVEDGDLMNIPGRRLRALHTPGHTAGHLCLHDEDRALLFSGDHVLPTVSPGIGLGGRSEGNPIEEYLLQLHRLRQFDDCEVLPGHGFRFRGLTNRVTQIARHHLRRSAEVAVVLKQEPGLSTWDVASRLTWSRGWEGLTRHYLVAALRQTAMHARLVRDEKDQPLAALWEPRSPSGSRS